MHLIALTDIRPRRLLDTRSLELVVFGEDDTIPCYAILSHQWIHGEEVTFTDFSELRDGTTLKSGYLKIQAACQQALTDDFHYIWIDTCCIDNGNHNDVALNIKSMYAYYQNAEVCYAFLADVHKVRGNEHPSKSKKGTFERSEWFKRGWTLQELLAPRHVIFFNSDWTRLGCKHELKETIYSVTTIDPEVLSGIRPIQDVYVLERMSWVMGRQTSRPQDQAYCVLGILGALMNPNYDEHVEDSFERLRMAIINAHPDHAEHLKALGSGIDFYYLLMGRHWEARRDTIPLSIFPPPGLPVVMAGG